VILRRFCSDLGKSFTMECVSPPQCDGRSMSPTTFRDRTDAGGAAGSAIHVVLTQTRLTGFRLRQLCVWLPAGDCHWQHRWRSPQLLVDIVVAKKISHPKPRISNGAVTSESSFMQTPFRRQYSVKAALAEALNKVQSQFAQLSPCLPPR